MRTIDKGLRTHLETIFAPLNKTSAGAAFPHPASLSAALEKALPRRERITSVPVAPTVASMFATAAVEIWMRSVHSFLISASLTDASPIWASASGYYSSHYSVRALAHLLGYFHLFRRKQIVRLEINNGKYLCSFDRKQGNDREHRFYWRIVKHNSHFSSEPLFTENSSEDDASDVGHRDRANYADHVCQFPNFRALDEEMLKRRVHFISQIHFSTPPIPMRSRFPDVESVQVIAYHRLVRFRQFLDEILGGKSRFWNVHRVPSWTREMIDFQLAEQGGLSSLAN